MSPTARHEAEESTAKRRRRVVGSFAWLTLFDVGLANTIGSWFLAPLGVALVVVGVVQGEVWIIVFGAIATVLSVANVIFIVRRKR